MHEVHRLTLCNEWTPVFLGVHVALWTATVAVTMVRPAEGWWQPNCEDLPGSTLSRADRTLSLSRVLTGESVVAESEGQLLFASIVAFGSLSFVFWILIGVRHECHAGNVRAVAEHVSRPYSLHGLSGSRSSPCTCSHRRPSPLVDV